MGLFKNKLADGLPERKGPYWSAEYAPSYSPDDGWLPDDLDEIFATVNAMGTRLSRFLRRQERAALLVGYVLATTIIRTFALKEAEPPKGSPAAFFGL